MKKLSLVKSKNPKINELQKKFKKVKGQIQISTRRTWFTDAMEKLEKGSK